MRTLHEGLSTYLAQVFLEWESCRENKNMPFMFPNFFPKIVLFMR